MSYPEVVTVYRYCPRCKVKFHLSRDSDMACCHMCLTALTAVPAQETPTESTQSERVETESTLSQLLPVLVEIRDSLKRIETALGQAKDASDVRAM